MKINKLDSYILASNVKKHLFPLPSFINDGVVVIKLQIDEKIYGFGELSPYVDKANILKQIIEVKIKNIIINEDLLNFHFLIKKIMKIKIPFATKQTICAALKQAYYDLIGKCRRLPTYNILNQKIKQSKKINYYASGGMIFSNQDYNILIDEAIWAQENNFLGWKFRPKTPISNPSHFQRIKNPPSFDIKEIMSFIISLKKNLNPDFKLMIDVGKRIKDIKKVFYFCSFLKEMNFYFIEEPYQYNYSFYKKIQSNSKLKIAGGESYNKIDDISFWLSNNLLDFVQPDSNLINLDDIVSFFKKKNNKKKLILHNWCNPVSMFSNLNIYQSLKLDNIIEYNIIYNPLRDEILKENFNTTNPFKFNIKSHGLGVNISNEIIKKYDISKKYE